MNHSQGVPGILYGQNERVDELNSRILARFQPDVKLQPNINVRAVSTKYSHFPVVEERAQSKVPLSNYPSTNKFIPVNSNGPVAGYFSNVNTESCLRNQYFAIQRGAPQGQYVPSSKSDLYTVEMAHPSIIEAQPYPGLFDKYQQDPFIKPSKLNPEVGANTFLNNTRIQLRGGELV